MYAAKHDDIGVGFLSLPRQPERVPDIVGDVLNFRLLIIMREDDRVHLLFETLDLPEIVRPNIQNLHTNLLITTADELDT
ncbi:hypothetical protein BH20ACT10_BH20ACT10_21710 [soil metagenome]